MRDHLAEDGVRDPLHRAGAVALRAGDGLGSGRGRRPVAGFAFENEVGHELHFHRDDSRPLAFFASAALGVEREILRCVAHLFG